MLADEVGLEDLTHLLGRDAAARLHPRAKPRPPPILERARVHRRRNEHIGEPPGLGAGEPARSNTDDLKRLRPEPEFLSEHAWVSCKPARPVVVTDHGHRMTARRHVVTARQQSSKRGLKSEGWKHVAG